ncbi:DUF6002 family protein [Streptomyces sp. NPDC057575]|uniref:DUF6002 family protein n=1 Tax=unclassified Streptomyces TaxID=2593676 RepID=UPI0036B74DCA
MSVTSFDGSASARSANLILDHYDQVGRAIGGIVDDIGPARDDAAAFKPGFRLPELDDGLRRFFAAATVEWHELGGYGEHRLHLMDLTGNPGTGTTKTFPSLLMVARAVEYIRRYDESVTIFSPTSANKGTALRDAVLRAIDAGLVTPEQLRVVIIAPASCRSKLRDSRLSQDPTLRALNPMFLYTGQESEQVKAVGREFVDMYATEASKHLDTRLWYSLELSNYLVADTARAFFEQRALPDGGAGRVHAHAVSSAFGLLGYHEGRAALERAGLADEGARPESLLVQHLGTPDMVLNLAHGDFSRDGMPAYELRDGLYHQSADPRFPQVTADPGEVLDPTFYTHRPVTSPAMNELIRRYGGNGIVVSGEECRERYEGLRDRLSGTGCALPADPAALREQSLVMGLTGVMNAVDRGLIGGTGKDIVVHGSGAYATSDYRPLEHFTEISGPQDIASALYGRA